MFELPEQKPRKTPKARYIKPDSVNKLENDVLELKKLKFPNQPYLIKKKLRDDTANGLTACIQEWAKVNNAFCQRQNSQGQWDVRLGRYRHSGTTKGIADLLILWNGITIHVEVKINRDKQSKVQKEVQESIENAGGIYIIVKSFDNFLEKVKEYG